MSQTFTSLVQETRKLLINFPKSTYDPDGLKNFLKIAGSDARGVIFLLQDEGKLKFLKGGTTVKKFLRKRKIKGSSITVLNKRENIFRISDEQCPDYWTPYAQEISVYFFVPMQLFKKLGVKRSKKIIDKVCKQGPF